MCKRKILFMINSLYGGGAEKIFQTVLDNFNYEKFDVTVYFLRNDKINYDIYNPKAKYKCLFGHDRVNSIWDLVMTLYDKIKGKSFLILPSSIFYRLFVRGKYDVEIAFIEGESTKIISGSTNKKSKKIAWVHIDLHQNPWTDFIYKGIEDESKHYQRFDEILCVSNSVKEAFISKYNINSQKVFTQYNPIDVEEIKKKSEEKIDLLPSDKLRIISVGRLVDQKGFDRLLRVVKKLKDKNFDFELLILGDGEKRKELENYILTNHLEGVVKLLGFKKNPYAYMKQSDLLVCSSRSEGFSTVVTEGVVLGLPIVSTECAGIRELFGNEECGMIVDNNEEALFNALSHIFAHPENLYKFRESSKKRGEFFSLERVMHEIEGRLLN